MHSSLLDAPLTTLGGRSLLSSLSALAAAGLIEPQFVAGILAGERDLGRLAAQPPSALETHVEEIALAMRQILAKTAA